MAFQNLFVSKIPITWTCIFCGADVPSEKNINRDQHGHVIIWYTPASRYWTDAGVFCCVEHGIEYASQLQKAKTIIT